MFKYLVAGLIFVMALGGGSAMAFFSFLTGDDGYQYISAEELNNRLQAGDEMILLDICPADKFAEGHITGSIETNAYPVRTNEERLRLNKGLAFLQASDADIIIVCPGGGGGARRTIDYYQDHGIDAKRMLILEDGLRKWPHDTVSK